MLVCQVPMLVTVGTTIVCLASVRPDCSALAPRVSRHCAGKGGRATVPGLAHAQLGMQGLFGVPLTSMVIVCARASSCIAHTVMLSAMRLLRRPWPSHLPGLPLRPFSPVSLSCVAPALRSVIFLGCSVIHLAYSNINVSWRIPKTATFQYSAVASVMS